MSLIPDTIQLYLPVKQKKTPSGWISFCAPCCDDTRHRGGFIINEGDAVSYHCFNCNFKASWQPGRQLSKSMKKFMFYLNIPDETITKLSFEAIKLLNEQTISVDNSIIPKFDARYLPLNSQPITSFLDNIPTELIPVLTYIRDRGLCLDDYNFYWTPEHGFNTRLIIPFYYQNKIVGFTARTIGNDKIRYISEQQPGYVFNLDHQTEARSFVFVCEGPIDAISIDCCSIMGADIKEQQNWQLQRLNKEIVLIPDRDMAGKAVIKQALEYGWSVSMPDYPDGVKDINDCVVKIGRLATFYLIIKHIQRNPLKIQLREKQWFKEKQ